MSLLICRKSAALTGSLLLASCSALNGGSGESEEANVLEDHGGGYVRLSDFFEDAPALRLGEVEVAPDIEVALIRQAEDKSLPEEEVKGVLDQLKKEIGDGLLDLAANKAIGANVIEAAYAGEGEGGAALEGESVLDLECSLIALELAGASETNGMNIGWIFEGAATNARFKAVVKLRLRENGRLLVAKSGEGKFSVEQNRKSRVEESPLKEGDEPRELENSSSQSLTLNGPVKRAVEIAVQAAWSAAWDELKKRKEFQEAEAAGSGPGS